MGALANFTISTIIGIIQTIVPGADPSTRKIQDATTQTTQTIQASVPIQTKTIQTTETKQEPTPTPDKPTN